MTAVIFVETGELIVIWKCKGPRTIKTILKKNNKVGRLAFPDFKTYYKAAVIRTVCLTIRIDI